MARLGLQVRRTSRSFGVRGSALQLLPCSKVVEPLLQGGGRRGEQVRWGFFAVYDGHGGRQEVDYCEKKLHDVVLAELRAMVPGPNCQEGVKAALASAFKKVDRQLEMLGAWSSGCTATVALVRRQSAGATLFVANVGDSRAVLLGGRRGFQRVSRDHKASDPAEAQRVVEELAALPREATRGSGRASFEVRGLEVLARPRRSSAASPPRGCPPAAAPRRE
ncbi:unnamed protein product, partial [Prorocentrum cordatum]